MTANVPNQTPREQVERVLVGAQSLRDMTPKPPTPGDSTQAGDGTMPDETEERGARLVAAEEVFEAALRAALTPEVPRG